MGHNGLLSFISCTIHVVHNAFHKGIVALHQDVEGLAHELHGLNIHHARRKISENFQTQPLLKIVSFPTTC